MKRKTINLNEDVYSEIKSYCKDNALKISEWVSLVLKQKINEEVNGKKEKKN